MRLSTILNRGIESIAVVGASPKSGKVSNIILRNLINSGFKGRIYPVNPKYEEILGVKCWPNLISLPEPPDVVLVAVPPNSVPAVVSQAREKHCKLVVVITAGFKEVGRKDLELSLRREAGDKVRVIGPNSAGIYIRRYNLYASIEVIPRGGKVGIITQSGAVGGALSYALSKLSSGPSFMLSLGNMCDVDINEALEYALNDANTEAVIVYIEWLRNGREFIRIAKELTRSKPLIVIKGGRGEVSSKAIISHTGGLAGNYEVFLGAMKQCGAYVASDVQEACEVTEVLRRVGYVRGDRILVLTNSGGLGILVASLLEDVGASLPELPNYVLNELISNVGKQPTGRNPMDFGGDTELEKIISVLSIRELRNYYDLIILTYVPTALDSKSQLCKIFNSINKENLEIPVLVYYEGSWKEDLIVCISRKLPVVSSLSNLAKAVNALMYRSKKLSKSSII